MPRTRAFLVLAATLLAATPLQGGWVWTAKTGWYNPARTVRSTPEEIFSGAGRAFEAGHYRDAARGYRILLQSYPTSPLVDPALLQLLESEFLGKEFDRALNTIEVILARRPDAETISRVVKRKYEIGAAYLTGTPRHFWGIPMSAEGRAIEVLTGLVERFPYEPYSDDALFHMGTHYYRKASYRKCQLIFERLIRDYPQSDWAAVAEYQIGESALKQLKGVEYDFAPLNEAERRFNRYLRRYPGGDKADEARVGLDRIYRIRSERTLEIAKFYRKDRRPKAARHYLQKILKDYPDSEAAGEARKILKRIASNGD